MYKMCVYYTFLTYKIKLFNLCYVYILNLVFIYYIFLFQYYFKIYLKRNFLIEKL